MNIVSTLNSGNIVVRWYDLQGRLRSAEMPLSSYEAFRASTPYMLLDQQGNIQSVFNVENAGVSVTPESQSERVPPHSFNIAELEAIGRNLRTPRPPVPTPVPTVTSTPSSNTAEQTFVGYDGTGETTRPVDTSWITEALEAARRREVELMRGRTSTNTVGVNPFLAVEETIPTPSPTNIPENDGSININNTMYYSSFGSSSSSSGRFTVNGISSSRNDENSSTTPRKKYNGMSVEEYMSSLGY